MNNINMLYAIWIVGKFTLFIVMIFEIYILIGKDEKEDLASEGVKKTEVFFQQYNSHFTLLSELQTLMYI